VSRALIAIGAFVFAVSNVAAATLSLPDDAVGLAGGAVSVPLAAIPAAGILGMDITLAYDSAVLAATGVTKTPISNSFTLTYNLSTPGLVRISLFGTTALSGSGPIADLQFDVVGSPGQTSQLDLTFAQINEGAIPGTLDDGMFTVCTGAPAIVSGVAVSKTPATSLLWAGQFAAVYDVVSGLVGQLRVDGGVAGASCQADDQAVASWSDPRPDPAAGTGFYYLIRAQGGCGTGSYGQASSGAERVPTIGCP
jgi:hypothetical protein